VKVPSSSQVVTPPKTWFFSILTNVPAGHVPDTVTGLVVVREPDCGLVITAAVVGAGPRTVPESPTDPVCGFTAGTAACAAQLEANSSTPTMSNANVNPAYDVWL
jgi:hypothetical protein